MIAAHIFAAAVLLSPQNPADLLSKGPPAVEGAVRARVQEFYQHHVDGKFRLAEPLVAEEAKDDFYSGNKPRCLKFEIPNIQFNEALTAAKATVICTMYVNMMGFMGKPVPVPLPSHWKLIEGQWYWYVPPVTNATPFGKMTPGPGAGAGGPLPGMPTGAEAQALLQRVKADRDAVQFSGGEGGSAQVTITSAMPGKVGLAVTAPPSAGITAQLDRTELNEGGKAVVTIKAAPSKSPRIAGTVMVEVSPTGQLIPIRVSFTQ